MKKEKLIVFVVFMFCFAIFFGSWMIQENNNIVSGGQKMQASKVILKLSETFPLVYQEAKENVQEQVDDISEKEMNQSNEIQAVDPLKPVNKELQPVKEYEIPITSRPPEDAYPNDGEIIGTIRCDDIGLYTSIAYGDSQSNIDLFDVTQHYNLQINSNANVLLAGHNNKSFAKLFHMKVGYMIHIHTYYGDFDFVVANINQGTVTKDDSNILDEYGMPLYDAYSNENKLILYTCGDNPRDRFVITALPV